ncbi:class-II DAHP synthetase family-domain-containing protein [Russula aff. rugulosa BPL654]|nr:class-II DAHP synthetase family-domain-containing protein [Russula aff. rugulosa BPL654]
MYSGSAGASQLVCFILMFNLRFGNHTGVTPSFHPDERTPDPERLLSAHFHSTATLNHIRALLTSGFGSLHHPRDWSLSHVRSPSLKAEYATIFEGLADALDFTRTIGRDSGREAQSYERGGGRGVLSQVDLHTRSVLLQNMARLMIISEN